MGVCTKKTRTPMISVIDEDVILRFAVYHLPTPSSNRTFLAHENCEEVISGDLITGVVLQPFSD